MDSLTANMPLLVFTIIGTIAFASSILVVAMRNPVHSALFLLLTFLCVAVLFVMQDAEFLAAVQVLVYAGGIMVLFLFVVMLINVRHLPDERVLSSFWKGGFAVFLGLMILFVTLVRPGVYHDPNPNTKLLRSTTRHIVRRTHHPDGTVTVKHIARNKVEGNSQAVGTLLYTDYLVPFEIASLFLLVAMIGAIVIGKREMSALEEETVPGYMLRRVQVEKEVKHRIENAELSIESVSSPSLNSQSSILNSPPKEAKGA
jgi:NADH-quinone oxidoreductase subunit J